jgi:hypothetical protein
MFLLRRAGSPAVPGFQGRRFTDFHSPYKSPTSLATFAGLNRTIEFTLPVADAAGEPALANLQVCGRFAVEFTSNQSSLLGRSLFIAAGGLAPLPANESVSPQEPFPGEEQLRPPSDKRG